MSPTFPLYYTLPFNTLPSHRKHLRFLYNRVASRTEYVFNMTVPEKVLLEKHLNELHIACVKGDMYVIHQLFEQHGVTIDDARSNYNRCLFCACEYGRIEVVRYLFEEVGFTDIDARYKNGAAFIHACESGNTELVRYLVETVGLTVRDAQISTKTALLHSCMQGHIEVVQYLVNEVGLNIDDVEETNYDCVYIPCKNGHREIVEFLISELTLSRSRLYDVAVRMRDHVIDRYGREEADIPPKVMECIEILNDAAYYT